jgi:hypothetical protein
MPRKPTMTRKRKSAKVPKETRSDERRPKRAAGAKNAARSGRRSQMGTRVGTKFSEARESEAQEIERNEES